MLACSLSAAWPPKTWRRSSLSSGGLHGQLAQARSGPCEEPQRPAARRADDRPDEREAGDGEAVQIARDRLASRMTVEQADQAILAAAAEQASDRDSEAGAGCRVV